MRENTVMNTALPRTYRSSWSCESDVDAENRLILRKPTEDSRNHRRRVMSVCSDVERLTFSCMREIASLRISELDVRKIVDEVVRNLCPADDTRDSLCRLQYDSDSSSGYSCSHVGSTSSSLRKRFSICSSRVSVCSSGSSHQRNCCLHGLKFGSPHVSTSSSSKNILQDTRRTSSEFGEPLHDKYLRQFDRDSLGSSLSTDSLNDLSIFSRDSLNSMSEMDSLEYSPTVCSVDSLDSYYEYDSLSDGKDSGFFSNSLNYSCS